MLSLSNYIGKDNEQTINLLKDFITFSKNGKIFLNQNNKLCKLEELKNEGKNKDDIIPEELKNISKNVGYDIKEILVHENMERTCSENLSFSEFCKDLDDRVIENCHKQIYCSNNQFKQSLNNLIETYFEKIGEKKAKFLFPKIFSAKENIILNIIYDKQTRENMAKLGQSYGTDAIPKILDNPKLVNLIMEGKIQDNNYENLVNLLENKIIVTDDTKKIGLAFNSNCISEEQVIFCKNNIYNFVKYGNDFENFSANKITGISGEAYIYELLSNSGKYKNVTWKMLNEKGIGELFEYNGKKYYINSSEGSHYDIVVETFEGNKYFFEIKSTAYKFENKVPFYLSQKQIETMESIKSPNKYI